MTALEDALQASLAQLAGEGARVALVGGLAVSAWVDPRFTRDIDLAVAVDEDRDAEQLVHRLQACGFAIVTVVEQIAAGRLATARLRPPGHDEDGLLLDLLFASSGIEREVAEAAVHLDIGLGTPVPVARPGHLVALKLLAQDPVERPQDAQDLRALRPVLGAEDVELARDACRRIEARGFHRGRHLEALLDEYLT